MTPARDWQQIPKTPAALFIRVNSERLKIVKARLGELGADVSKIDSCARSIDRGEPFKLCFEIEENDPAQLALI